MLNKKVLLFFLVILGACSAFAVQNSLAEKPQSMISIKPLSTAGAEKFIRLVQAVDIKTFQKLAWHKDQWSEYLMLPGKYGAEYFNLYKVDVNNDGRQEYVLTRFMQGSGDYSGLAAVFAIHNNKLIAVNINAIIKSNLKLKEEPANCVNWYCRLAHPFLVKNKDLIYMHYAEKDKTCVYLWQKESFTLVGPEGGSCIE